MNVLRGSKSVRVVQGTPSDVWKFMSFQKFNPVGGAPPGICTPIC